MLLTGIVTPRDALLSINWETIVLIFGMMLIVSGMDASGFFKWISSILVRAAKSQKQFIAYTTLITAFLSALILNDAVVLIFTPVIIASARKMGVSPVPPLIMEAISANIGSAATEVGNPQNAFIANVSHIGFHVFTAYLLPATIAALAFGVLFAVAVTRKETAFPPEPSERAVERPTPQMYFVACVVIGVFAAFYALPVADAPITAMIGGVVTLIALPLMAAGRVHVLAARVDWGILLFFIGLFILIAGVESSGLLGLIVGMLHSVDGRLLNSVAGLTLLTAVLSNMVSNVPAVLLLSPIVQGSATPRLWLTLAAASTFAGNATIVGAAANVIVVRAASKEGVRIRLSAFMKYGLPITIASLLLTVLFLQVL